MTYSTLGHTHTGIVISEDKGEYKPPKKGIYLEMNFLIDHDK